MAGSVEKNVGSHKHVGPGCAAARRTGIAARRFLLKKHSWPPWPAPVTAARSFGDA